MAEKRGSGYVKDAGACDESLFQVMLRTTWLREEESFSFWDKEKLRKNRWLEFGLVNIHKAEKKRTEKDIVIYFSSVNPRSLGKTLSICLNFPIAFLFCFFLIVLIPPWGWIAVFGQRFTELCWTLRFWYLLPKKLTGFFWTDSGSLWANYSVYTCSPVCTLLSRPVLWQLFLLNLNFVQRISRYVGC